MSNELNYSDYSFENLVVQLQNRLKAASSWKDTYRSSTGQMLIEFYAYVANLINYYIERRSQEGYIATAQLRSSIINLVRLLNYFPRRKVSSTGILTFSISPTITKNIYIPKYTECQTAVGVKFLTLQDVVLLANQSSINSNAIQGQLISIELTADGSLNYSYNIKDTSVENSNIEVLVNDTIWTKVDSFIDSIATSKHYKIITELDDTVTITFGDNVFGLSPSIGDSIIIRYVKSDGVSGNIYETGKITTINSTIYDQDETPRTLTVTNNDVFLGGEDEENTEEIRSNAPQVFATGNRAVTRADFVVILKDYPGIADANAWGENEESPPNYDMFNRVKLVVILQDWQFPSNTFKTTLGDYLYDLSMMTVKYEFIDPTIIYIVPTIQIKALTTGTLSQIEADVTNAIENQFELGTTTKLGVSKRLSDIFNIVDNTTGVDYCYVTLEVRKDLVSNYLSTYEWGITCDALPIKPNTVKIYINDILSAQDDGAGNITNIISAPTTTGSVNYTNGLIEIDITPNLAPTDIVYVRYQQDNSSTDEEGDVVVTKNQICKLFEVNITNISYVS